MNGFIYTNWNLDMSSAPKGKTVTKQVLFADKNSASGQSLKSFDEFVPDLVILASECKKVIKSYWLPDENRWAGFSEKSRPVAWQPWPEWPAVEVEQRLAFEAAQ